MRWEERDPESGRRLGPDFYGRPDGWLEELHHQERRSGWLAFVGRVPIGLIDLDAEPLVGLGYLTLYVAPGFRGRAVGAELAVHAAETARGTGLCGLAGEVEPDNVACAGCLKKAGFSEFAAGGSRTRLFGLDLPSA